MNLLKSLLGNLGYTCEGCHFIFYVTKEGKTNGVKKEKKKRKGNNDQMHVDFACDIMNRIF